MSWVNMWGIMTVNTLRIMKPMKMKNFSTQKWNIPDIFLIYDRYIPCLFLSHIFSNTLSGPPGLPRAPG